MAYPNYPHEGGLVIPTNVSSNHIRNGEPAIPFILPNFEQDAYTPFAKILPNVKLPKFSLQFSLAKKIAFDGEPHLFLHRPTMDDVLQGGLGDCFLLSTICGILDKDWGPDYIERMMCMSPDGQTVTVRLFDFFTTEEPRVRANVARYVTVDYSQIVGKFREGRMGATGAPWVHVLEKAFAGFNYGQLFASASEAGAYLGLGDGGLPCRAMQALLGTAYESESLVAREDINPWAETMDRFLRYGVTSGGLQPDASAMAEFTAWHSQTIVSKWDAFCNPDFYDEGTDTARRNYVRRLEDVVQFLNDNACPDSVRDLISMSLLRNQVYPSKRGTAVYADWQMSAHMRYQRLLREGKVMVAATRSYKFKIIAQKTELFGIPVGLPDASTLVPEGKGLLWGHGYTVLSGAPAQTTVPPPAQELRTLWVRNPWGSMGRIYRRKTKDRATLKAEASPAHPVFWLELNDLLKRFERIDYCDPPPADEIAPAVPVLLP